jgi:hypothetical protein
MAIYNEVLTPAVATIKALEEVAAAIRGCSNVQTDIREELSSINTTLGAMLLTVIEKLGSPRAIVDDMPSTG